MGNIINQTTPLTTNYTIIDNKLLRHKGLSLKSKALYALLCSLPTNWDFSIMGLCGLLEVGKQTIISGLCELEQVGLIERGQENKKGKFGATYLNILPTTLLHTSQACSSFPHTDKPNAENPQTDNPSQQSKDFKKYRKSKVSTSDNSSATNENLRVLQNMRLIDPNYLTKSDKYKKFLEYLIRKKVADSIVQAYCIDDQTYLDKVMTKIRQYTKKGDPAYITKILKEHGQNYYAEESIAEAMKYRKAKRR